MVAIGLVVYKEKLKMKFVNGRKQIATERKTPEFTQVTQTEQLFYQEKRIEREFT